MHKKPVGRNLTTHMGLLVELETCFMPIIVSEIK
jgi:hypothetical protein